MRVWVGTVFIKIGFAIIPSEISRMVRGLIMYHVPNALGETEKAEVRDWVHANAPTHIKTKFP